MKAGRQAGRKERTDEWEDAYRGRKKKNGRRRKEGHEDMKEGNDIYIYM